MKELYNMKNIPTAEELLLAVVIDNNNSFDLNDFKITSDVTKAMVEFAKIHVQEALKQASQNVKTKEEWWQDNGNPNGFSYTAVDRDSILNAYPLTNIK
jgi:negative regulator of sigma E activity